MPKSTLITVAVATAVIIGCAGGWMIRSYELTEEAEMVFQEGEETRVRREFLQRELGRVHGEPDS